MIEWFGYNRFNGGFNDKDFSSIDSIQTVSFNYHCSIVITNGRVLSFGKFEFEDRLGIINDHSISQVACGSDGQCYYFLSNDGIVYICSSESQFDRMVIQGAKISLISAGDQHCLLLDDQGIMYAFGSNRNGELGVGDSNERKEITRVPLIQRMKSVYCGSRHSLSISIDGRAYSFGWGGYLQLGHDSTDDESTPREIAWLRGCTSIRAGHWHSVVLTDDGSVFTFGFGVNGALGHGDEKGRSTPKRVEFFSGNEIVDIATGSRHTVFLDRMGAVYCCGYLMNSKSSEFVRELIPKKINDRVEKVFAGGWSTLTIRNESNKADDRQNET